MREYLENFSKKSVFEYTVRIGKFPVRIAHCKVQKNVTQVVRPKLVRTGVLQNAMFQFCFKFVRTVGVLVPKPRGLFQVRFTLVQIG